MNTITTNVVIQISKEATNKKFIHLNTLVTAIHEDVDLQPIPQEDRTEVLQSLFVVSGSDFTSFFVGLVVSVSGATFGVLSSILYMQFILP